MSVDKFGRFLAMRGGGSNKSLRGPPGTGYKFTKDGNYDVENKRLCRVGEAIESDDAITKQSLEYSLQDFNTEIDKIWKFVRTLIKDLRLEVAKNKTDLTDLLDSSKNIGEMAEKTAKQLEVIESTLNKNSELILSNIDAIRELKKIIYDLQKMSDKLNDTQIGSRRYEQTTRQKLDYYIQTQNSLYTQFQDMHAKLKKLEEQSVKV